MRTAKWVMTLLLAAQVCPTVHGADALPGEGDDAGKTVIYRDTWGIPHIYAPTDVAGLYAQGYAIAEDRPELLLQNLLTAIGELSSIAGPAAVQSDLRSHMWDHYGVGKRNWDQIRPRVQEHIKAFTAGINAFYEAHPEDVPVWWEGRKVDEFMIVAFGRLFLYNWSIDEAYEDLERGGIKPGYEAAQRGSNQFAVAPSRSAEGAAILAIDPHLAWFGPSRFWEFRIHAGDLHGSGVTLPGSPYIGLGHNADLAWAMTTGGPDTADVFELTLKEGDPTQYKYDDEWRSLESREVTLKVRGEDDQTHTLWFSHHGPIIALRDGKAYAGATSYADLATTSGAWYDLNYAKDYHGAIEAMDTLSVFPQNVMVADTSGNIYFQRTGRVPRRSMDYDWARPVDGSTSKSEWQGVHPAADHLQVLNPPQGYMQNCNIPPDAMMPNSPFSLDKHLDYLYSGPGYGSARAGWTNQRGARAIELLQADDSVTAAEAMAIINDVKPFGADRWLDVLRRAHKAHGKSYKDDALYTAGIEDLLAWDGALSRDSSGALKYVYWRDAIASSKELRGALENGIDDWYAIVEGRRPKSINVSKQHLEEAAKAFSDAMATLYDEWGTLDVVYGDRFRVGRDSASWPVGGGSGSGSRTLRTMGYSGQKDDGTNWGRSGQTSTQIVVLSKPIKSWIYLPIGQSDRPGSTHYRDQAEHLFSKRELKPSWWMPEDLKGHIESTTYLDVKLDD